MNALSRMRNARMRASTASTSVAPVLRPSTASAASSARGATGMPFSSSVRNSDAASAARAIDHDGLVIAGTSASKRPASRSANARRSIVCSLFARVGGACCETMRSIVSISSAASSPFGARRAASFAYGCASTCRP